jgi:hypothetical protein
MAHLLDPVDTRRLQPLINHRHQVGLQIFLPLTTIIIIIFSLITIASINSMKSPALGARISTLSTIFLIIPILIPGIIFLITIVGIIYMLGKIPRQVRHYSSVVGIYFFRIEIFTNKWSAILVEPLYRLIIFKTLIKDILYKGMKLIKSNNQLFQDE